MDYILLLVGLVILAVVMGMVWGLGGGLGIWDLGSGLGIWGLGGGPECRILNVYFANDPEELEYFRQHISPKLKAHPSVKWYLGKFSDGTVTTLDTNSTWVPAGSPIQWFRRVFAENTFDGLVYSGHSGGPYLGNEDDPMISVSEFTRVLRGTKRELAFIWFDSCNMGFLQSLVLLNGVAKYVVGAPNYYDWQSVLQTREIYHLGRGDAGELEQVIRSQASKYDGDADTLVELCVYRVDRLNTLWSLYKQYRGQLVHSESGKIEGDYYDVQDIISDSVGVVDPSVLRSMQSALDSGVVSRSRCDECALDVRDSILAVQKNKDLDGGDLDGEDLDGGDLD